MWTWCICSAYVGACVGSWIPFGYLFLYAVINLLCCSFIWFNSLENNGFNVCSYCWFNVWICDNCCWYGSIRCLRSGCTSCWFFGWSDGWSFLFWFILLLSVSVFVLVVLFNFNSFISLVWLLINWLFSSIFDVKSLVVSVCLSMVWCACNRSDFSFAILFCKDLISSLVICDNCDDCNDIFEFRLFCSCKSIICCFWSSSMLFSCSSLSVFCCICSVRLDICDKWLFRSDFSWLICWFLLLVSFSDFCWIFNNLLCNLVWSLSRFWFSLVIFNNWVCNCLICSLELFGWICGCSIICLFNCCFSWLCNCCKFAICWLCWSVRVVNCLIWVCSISCICVLYVVSISSFCCTISLDNSCNSMLAFCNNLLFICEVYL